MEMALLWLLAAALLVTAIVFLSWDKIIDWFRGRSSLIQSDRDNIAFSVKEKLSSGNYAVVQGVFNDRTDQVLDAQKYDAQDVCDKIKYGDQLMIYT